MVNTCHFPDAHLNHMVFQDLEHVYEAELTRTEAALAVRPGQPSGQDHGQRARARCRPGWV